MLWRVPPWCWPRYGGRGVVLPGSGAAACLGLWRCHSVGRRGLGAEGRRGLTQSLGSSLLPGLHTADWGTGSEAACDGTLVKTGELRS